MSICRLPAHHYIICNIIIIMVHHSIISFIIIIYMHEIKESLNDFHWVGSIASLSSHCQLMPVLGQLMYTAHIVR